LIFILLKHFNVYHKKNHVDLIGVISHIGPHDFASLTSQTKLRKIKIQDLKCHLFIIPFDCLLLHHIFFYREKTQEIQLWGEHGENFDEKTIIEKLKQCIVVAVFSGFTSESFKS
jgi:hypothetical protein